MLDFGSQYSRLIARRIREANVYCEILPHSTPWGKIASLHPKGFVLSGGPASVYDDGAPRCADEVFTSGIPVLGICYGMQLMAHQMGGKVAPCFSPRIRAGGAAHSGSQRNLRCSGGDDSRMDESRRPYRGTTSRVSSAGGNGEFFLCRVLERYEARSGFNSIPRSSTHPRGASCSRASCGPSADAR